MTAQNSDVRLLMSEELKAIRSKIVEGTVVLFVGEQVSTLVSPENPRPSLDDWWHFINHHEVRSYNGLCKNIKVSLHSVVMQWLMADQPMNPLLFTITWRKIRCAGAQGTH